MDTPVSLLVSGILIVAFFVRVLTYFYTYARNTRSRVDLPNNFHSFINDRVIPSFKDQRASGQYQFSVLLLLSEEDLADITHMPFSPSIHLGQPLVDNIFASMPQDLDSFGNYIVARPSHNSWHSEEVIFSESVILSSPFSCLWDAYVECSGQYPKCILLYSWNLPCSRCTDVIIRSLGDRLYKETSVIVAHTAYWKWSENSAEHRENEDRLNEKNTCLYMQGVCVCGLAHA